MSKTEHSEKSVATKVAIISGVFAVLAACIGLGVPIIEWGLSKINPTPSQVAVTVAATKDTVNMPIPTITHTVIPPTKPPTFTVPPPTMTRTPTEIPPTNTPTTQPNTGLQLGQTYRQG
ncbi:MAG: hypothetical protein M5U11_12985 [Anaerolineales bacterium]|nr:hypothetical protein [Anaerolineales bacterium]